MIPRPLLVLLAMLVPAVASAQDLAPCQVRELSAYWGTSAEEASATAAAKLRGGQAAELIEAKFMASKLPTQCAWSETIYTYADAEVLAQIWGVTPEQAKRDVEAKIANGLDYYVAMQLQEGVPKAEDPKYFVGDEFFNYGYFYCDAKILAAAWDAEPYDAKIQAAKTLLSSESKFPLEEDLKRGTKKMKKQGGTCDFWETGWYPGDAELLAQVWGVPLEESKARIGRAVAQGRTAKLYKQMNRAKLGK